MAPLEIYTLFVLPGLLLAASGGFVVYGVIKLKKRGERATRLETEAKVQAGSRLGLPPLIGMPGK